MYIRPKEKNEMNKSRKDLHWIELVAEVRQTMVV